MQGLWHTIALIAQDAGSFNADLKAICAFTPDPTLLDDIQCSVNPQSALKLNLIKQPSQATLTALDAYLRTTRGLILYPYELAELNRIFLNSAALATPHKNLKDYWNALGPVCADAGLNPVFLTAVGALVSDRWLMSEFALNHKHLSAWFPITLAQEDALRQAVAPGSPARVSAEDYETESWPGHVCGSRLALAPDWIHFNV